MLRGEGGRVLAQGVRVNGWMLGIVLGTNILKRKRG